MATRQLKVTIELWQKGKWFLARIPELDIMAQGKSVDEAKKNLNEVVKIQFSEMKGLGTLADYLAECGFHVEGDIIEPDTDIIGFEKHILQVA